MYKIGFIGAGNMGLAIMKGILKRNPETSKISIILMKILPILVGNNDETESWWAENIITGFFEGESFDWIVVITFFEVLLLPKKIIREKSKIYLPANNNITIIRPSRGKISHVAIGNNRIISDTNTKMKMLNKKRFFNFIKLLVHSKDSTIELIFSFSSSFLI